MRLTRGEALAYIEKNKDFMNAFFKVISVIIFIIGASVVFGEAPDEKLSWHHTQRIKSKDDILKVVKSMAQKMDNAVMINNKTKLSPDALFRNLNRKYYFDYATQYWYYHSSSELKFIIKLADNAILAAAYHNPKLRRKLSADEETALKVAMDCVKNTVKPSMSRMQKVKVLHDAIAKMCDYDYSNEENQSCVSVLAHHKGACGAYARTLWLMLNMINIPCHVIQGKNKNATNSPHAWVLVQMDGVKWYHVDVCKDDANNVLTHRLFAVTDEEMAKYHIWDKVSYPKTPQKK